LIKIQSDKTIFITRKFINFNSPILEINKNYLLSGELLECNELSISNHDPDICI